MGNNLPEGWEIKNLVECIPIVKTGVREYKGEKPYYSTGAVVNDSISPEGHYSFKKKPSRANRLVVKSDVVQARMRGTTKALLINEKLDGSLFSTGFLQFRPSEHNYNSKLFYHYLCSDLFLKQRDEFASGSTQIALTDKGASHINLVIPPPEQQKRIADKLDSLIAKVKDAQSRLDKIPLILKRLRQALVENTFSDIDEEKIVVLGDALPKRGIFDGPFGSNLKTADYTSSGVRVVRLENIGRLKFIEEKESYISNEKYKTLLKHMVVEGDVIVASFIADEVRVCVLPKFKTKVIAKADCFCIRPDKNIDSEFLAFQLTCSRVYDLLVREIHGVTRPRINTTQLKKLKVYIPGIEEQTAIVRKIKHLFEQLDHIEEYYVKIKNYTDKLEQSILAKAFRGELAMQNSNSDSANELLKKTKAKRK